MRAVILRMTDTSFSTSVQHAKAAVASHWISNHQNSQTTGVSPEIIDLMRQLKEEQNFPQSYEQDHVWIPHVVPNVVPTSAPYTVPSGHGSIYYPPQVGTTTGKIKFPTIPTRRQLDTRHLKPSAEYAAALEVLLKAGFQEVAGDNPSSGRATQRDFTWSTSDGCHEVFVTYLDLRPTGIDEEHLNFNLCSERDDGIIGAVALSGVPPTTVAKGLSGLVSGMILACEAIDIGVSPTMSG